jgi:acyl-CoA thioester hydrolase
MSSLPLVSRLRVRSCDVDSFGHVNNAVYLQYCEGARNDFLLTRGLTFADFRKWNAGPVLTRALLDFHAPAITDDELVIHGDLQVEGRIRFRIDHRIERTNDGVLVCRATLDFAFVELTTGRPCRIPEDFRSAFAPS